MSLAEFKIANKLITGKGSLKKLREEIVKLGIKHPLIITDEILQNAGVVKIVEDELQGIEYGIYNRVKPEPEVRLILDCANEIKIGGYDSVIAVGGGSAIDIAKSAAITITNNDEIENLFGTNMVKNKGIPIIAIPTTAGTGSEVTNIAILSDKEEQLKKGIVSPYLLPDVAIVSPEMTLTAPPSVTAASGIDALVHAIEAYISVNASPITDALALGAIKMISKFLPKAYSNPDSLEARDNMATASLMAGMAFGNAGVGAVHALAYPLGGRFNIAHGVSNALLLPYVMDLNKISKLEKFREIAEAMGENTLGLNEYEAADKAIEAMIRINRAVDIPKGLREFNIPENAISELAADAMKVTRLLANNPRKLRLHEVEGIYRAAY